MKATIKGRYEGETASSALATLAVNAGDVNLKASMSDATFAKGPSFNGLVLSVDKPGSFIVDYNVPKKDSSAATKTVDLASTLEVGRGLSSRSASDSASNV